MQEKIDLAKMRKLINRLPLARFRVDQARSRATRITPVLTGMPHGSGDGSKVEEGAILLILARDKYESLKDELKRMQEALSPMIDNISDPLQKNAMTMRYLESRSVREIAYCLNYSEQHIFRILQIAERNLKE